MKRILIVEDDVKIRRIYSGLLLAEGFEVLGACSVEEARDLIIRRSFDLVLLDINMPDYNGAALRNWLASFDPGMRVIVASVYPVSRQQRLIADAADYFDKSQGTAVLLGKVRQAVSCEDGPAAKDAEAGLLWNGKNSSAKYKSKEN